MFRKKQEENSFQILVLSRFLSLLLSLSAPSAPSALLSPRILFSVQDFQAAAVSFSTVAFLAAVIAAIFI
jgi:hypothetical protein